MNNIDLLVAELKEASEAYYNGDPIMTDTEWDYKLEELKKLDSQNPFLTQVGAKVTGGKWAKVKHEIVHGSQHKVKNGDEFLEWALKIKGPYVIQHKLDGITLVLKYENGTLTSAATRGDGVEGEEIYKNAILCEGVYQKASTQFSGTLRCELILPTSKFKAFFQPKGYKNERNSLGVIRSDEYDLIQHFRAVIFDIVPANSEFKSEDEAIKSIKKLIHKDAFPVATTICNSPEQVVKIYEEYEEKYRDKLDWLIDGLVVKVNDFDYQKSHGHTDNRPNGQIAIKFKPKTGITHIEDIIWSMGTTGRIAPVAIVDPVDVDGITIGRVTLNNLDWIKTMDVAIGDKVEIARANDVIPCLVKVINKSNRKLWCPKCQKIVEHIDGVCNP